MKKIYIDLCVYNRPFDDQKQPKIKLETDVFLYLLEQIEKKKYHVVNSIILEYENKQNPYIERREKVSTYLKLSSEKINIDESVIERAIILERYGIPSIDALHLAVAEKSKVNYFITCDNILLNKIRNLKIKLEISTVSPVEFVAMEGE
ncbi:MAG: hypothetical protein AUJ85_03185 [Elusimicrobia bacterium CG1_02_37_114]|nr:MAG: hypothetical protein AUJ85_03185 [Elusimicrobia bacterium CG1_02_37_114]PIZ12783.1 MAG: PIN domain-containing protein [Elusimicrobia bacterium CG_4_10_14_0_8_um_filter_37_32]